MLISLKYKFIYFKAIKVAGTSVEIYFERYCMPDGQYKESAPREECVSDAGIIGSRGRPSKRWRNHLAPRQIKYELNDDKIWNEYFKFGVIRNPWDRMVSSYLVNATKYDQGLPQSWGRRRLISVSEKPTFLQFVKTCDIFSPLMEPLFSFYSINNNIIVDYFISFEHLSCGIEYVCKKLGLTFNAQQLKHYKNSHRDAHYTEYYDDETKDIVSHLYKKDIEYFGYEFGD